MVVGILRISLIIHDNRSLKGKRRVVKGVAGRVRARFNVAIAEVGANDLAQRAEIGVVAVANDRAHVNSVLDKVLNFIEGLNAAEVADNAIEVINC